MRTFVTGGSGFIGSALVRALRERGDDVVALARSPETAGRLRALGCQTVAAALTDAVALAEAMSGSEAVFHAAGLYEVGLPDDRRPATYATNVEGTAAVIDAAVAAGAGRVVYVSTVNVLGNTQGRVVDERDLRERGAWAIRRTSRRR
jgi:dihydroflavonol-4-reductase